MIEQKDRHLKALQPLKNVHELLHEAALDGRPSKEEAEGWEPTSFREHPEWRTEADAICRQNGTTLSAFIRKCCRQLVKDYRPS